MDHFETLIGNEPLKKFFLSQIERGTLAHAYILEGGDGSGRHTLAYCVASALAGDTPEGARIARGQSPDVKICAPGRDKKQFTVDVVRALRADAFLLPADLPFKLFILEKTETMNAAAQNAALKILEEPPENTYFFLLCSNASALLPTIRSRAPVLRMQRFSVGELDAILSHDPSAADKKKLNPDFYYACLQQSDGCPGAAAQLLCHAGAAESRKLASELLDVITDRPALLLKSAELPRQTKQRRELGEVFTDLQWALRDLLVCRFGAGERETVFYTDAGQAMCVQPSLAKEQIIALIDLLSGLQAALEANANMQNLRFAFVCGVREALAR